MFDDRYDVLKRQRLIGTFNGQPIFLREELPHIWQRDMKPSNGPSTSSQTLRQSPWPLFTRGWVFQEEYLARRTLLFTRQEIQWMCREVSACECGFTSSERGEGLCEELKSTDWTDIVEEYSVRELTFPSDRLPALAGIAQVYKQRNPECGTCICGLWHGMGLLSLLLWQVTVPVERCPKSSCPSW